MKSSFSKSTTLPGIICITDPLGGGIEFAEFAEDALKREFMEEINEPLTDIRPLTVLESIFVLKGTMRHEHVFVYEANFANRSAYDRTDLKIIDDPESEVMWVAVELFKEHTLTLYPRGLLSQI